MAAVREAVKVAQGGQNKTGMCVEERCGKKARHPLSFYCEQHWHGRKWEQARHCKKGWMDKPCERCRVSYRAHHEDLRRAEGMKAQMSERSKAQAVRTAHALGLAVAAERAGVSVKSVRRWCLAAGVEWKVIPRPITHGKHRSCPCDRCKAGRRLHMRQQREKRQQQMRDGTMPAHLHGTTTGYTNWKCRCGPCVAAEAKATADRKRNRAKENAV